MTRAAVIGLGGIAAEHFAKLARIPDAEVAAICDLNPTLVDAVAERYGVGPGFTDGERMLAEVKPDVVHVLTPPATHRAIIRNALEAGAHVFAEKPITNDYAEYEELRDLATERGLLLCENYNYRFQAAVQRGLAILRSGEIGEPVNLEVSMAISLSGASYSDPVIPHFAHALPGGALRNFASHPASIVTAVMGEWSEVAVQARRLRSQLPGDDELRALIGGERTSALLTVTSNSQPYDFTFRVACTEGTLEVDVFAQRLHVDAASPGTARLTNPIRHGLGHLAATAALVRRAATTREGYFQGFEALLGGFYEAVAGRAEPPLTTADIDSTNRLVEALFAPESRA